MMDEAEEEALFARLRHGLEALRQDAARRSGSDVSVADPALTAAVARVEASLRTLASGLEALARRADGLDAAIETRIETTVARTTASLRADLDRLNARVAALAAPPRVPLAEAGARAARRRPARGRWVAAAAVVLLAAGAVSLQMHGATDDDWVTRAVAARVGEWRAALSGAPAAPHRGALVAAAAPSALPSPRTAAAPVEAASVVPDPAANHAVVPPPPVPVPVPAAPAASSGPPAPARSLSSPPSLSLRANAVAWVEVRHERGGRVVLNRTMRPGETWTAPADPDLTLSTGNAPAIEMIVDGQPRALPQGKGGVLKDVPLPSN